MTITGVSHIGLCVRDREASLRFYTEVLGFMPLVRMNEIDAPDVARGSWSLAISTWTWCSSSAMGSASS